MLYAVNVDVLAQAQIHHLRQRELDRRRSASEFAPLHTRDTPVKFQLQSLRRRAPVIQPYSAFSRNEPRQARVPRMHPELI
jgi:hypothetical protein